MVSTAEKFTGRAKSYSRNRPSYPDKILTDMCRITGMDKTWIVADMGSGTGKLAILFAENGNPVKCIEPNPDMRSELKRVFSGRGKVEIFDGTAEQSTLMNSSVDIVVCGQSFHWFRPDEVAIEFRRILRKGWVALIWNDRVDDDPFTSSYENIVRRYSPDYHRTGSLSMDEKTIKDFFQDGYELLTYPNSQKIDLEGMIGRYQSASYAISKSNPEFKNLLNEFRDLFNRYQEDGSVFMLYRTLMYIGRIS